MTTLSIATDGFLCGGTGTVGDVLILGAVDMELDFQEIEMHMDTEDFVMEMDITETEMQITPE